MPRILQVLLLVTCLVAGAIAGFKICEQRFSFDATHPSLAATSQQKKLLDVFNMVSAFYVDEVDDKAVVDAGIAGMMEVLDPHTTYLKADEVRYSNAELRGDFEGIGIEFDIVHDSLLVITPLPGGPSESTGIMAGDRIIAIDTVSAIGLTPMAAVNHLRGEKGSKVKLRIFRPFVAKTFTVDVVRDKISTSSVDAFFMLDRVTGYIRISRFIATTAAEFRNALQELLDQGMQKLIVDVRGNPGGYLDQAVKIADEFLRDKTLIVYTKSRNSRHDEIFEATSGGLFEESDVIVLIDRGSASAAEVFAGALQDNKRAEIVGELSFGKGLVQQQVNLDDGSALRLTIARYFTPSGRRIQRDFIPGKEGREEYYQDGMNGRDDETLFQKGDSSEVESSVEGITVYSPSPDRFTKHGGIVPDFWIVRDLDDGFYSELLTQGVLNETALRIIDNPSSSVRQFRKDTEGFLARYSEEKMIERYLRNICAEKDIVFEEEVFRRDKKMIMTVVKSRIARRLFGIDAQIRVLAEESDKTLRFAHEYLLRTAA